METKVIKIINTACILMLAGVVYFTSVHTAKNKLFWNDEGYDVFTLCQDSAMKILAGKTGITEKTYLGEANKSPLYYLLERISILRSDTFNRDILVQYRLVSIISGVVLAVIFYLFINRALGLFWSLFFTISLISQHFFYIYAAEARPYMLWMLTFACLLITTTKVCLHSWEVATFKEKCLFAAACILNSLVTSMGMIQSSLAILLCGIMWCFIRTRFGNLKAAARFLLPLFCACYLFALFYGSQGVHPNEKTSRDSSYDVLWTIKQGDYNLLKMPVRLLFPKEGRDAYPFAKVANGLTFIGLLTPLIFWGRRKELNKNEEFVFIFSTVTLVQVLSTIPIGTAIAVFHYWFVQRIFIYLIVCHAVLALIGAFVVFNFIAKFRVPELQKGIPVVKALLILTAFILSFIWHLNWNRQSVATQGYLTAGCPTLQGAYGSLSFEEIGVVGVNVNRYPTGEHNDDGFERPLNNFVMIDRRLKECSIKSHLQTDRLYIKNSADKGWHLATSFNQGEKYLYYCNQLVRFNLN